MKSASWNAPVETPASRAPQWRDLLLYLSVGIGGYIAASLLVEWLFKPTKMTLGLSVIAFSLNVLFIGGSALVLGAWRKQLNFSTIGFFPPRVTLAQLQLGILVSLAILPVRALTAAGVQQLMGGQLDSSQMRLNMIAPDGFTWLGFFVTLLGAGILAPIAEELFFRGALFGWFRRRFDFRAAALASSLLFGLAHIDTAAVVASSFVFALAAAYLYERTQTLWVPIVMHITSNSFAVLVIYAMLAFAPQLVTASTP